MRGASRLRAPQPAAAAAT
uniref:Uncharacterized protein n=1 Tax=Arundo donax TaxID=35708 RepID=A0A0A8ZVC9_ARUDO